MREVAIDGSGGSRGRAVAGLLLTGLGIAAVAAGVGADGGAGFDGAEKHLFASTAAGDEADAGFDEAHVELGVGLAGGGVE